MFSNMNPQEILILFITDLINRFKVVVIGQLKKIIAILKKKFGKKKITYEEVTVTFNDSFRGKKV